MIDFNHIDGANSGNTITNTFYAVSGSSWQTWQKPRGAKFIQIFCLGGGAGGQTGVVNGGGASGGRGGNSGGIMRGIIPAFTIPDILYIQVGEGGNGAPSSISAATGGSGSLSYVSIAPTTLSAALIAQSSAVLPSSTTTTVTATTVTTTAFANVGIFNSIAGVLGAIGSTSSSFIFPGVTQGSSLASLASSSVTGGGGGASKLAGATAAVSYSGGTVFSSSFFLLSNVAGGLPTGSTANGKPGSGSDGYYLMNPFCAMGGGGGSNGTSNANSNVGGRGGNGAYGCGGGGGGGATLGATSGGGGNGGDGLVIITTIK